jgi:hypothetical protein
MSADFSHLAASWVEWTGRARMPGVEISEACADCAISFRSDDQSFHLHEKGACWLVDSVDDRGHRYDAIAKFSAFHLAEKYLIWRWVKLVRSDLSSGALGHDLYRQGYALGVDVAELNGTHARLCLNDESAILDLGTATTFSHIMLMSLDKLEQIGRQGVT